MNVRILGTAAGGGLPQWNCACATCTSARTGTGRTQDCLAISAGDGWYLLNASPDIRTQILRTDALTPGPGLRETPLRGVLLTSGELDHTLGLVALREAEQLVVYATPTVLEALPWRSLMEPYGRFDWSPVPAKLGTLAIETVPVSAKPPKYASGEADDWAVAYRISDGADVLVYAPCLPSWSDAFAATLEGASWVLLDGSFYRDDELERRTGVARTARQMGHLPIAESLPHRTAYPTTRWIYTHLNNTNPALDPASSEHLALLAADAELAEEDARLGSVG